MANLKLLKQPLVRILLGILVLFFLLYCSVLLDKIPLSAARPPEALKNIEDFRNWKGDKITGSGNFRSEGVSYTVFLAPAGRYLASGPSAYLFDYQGKFVDWTPDMGDIYTVENRFDLSSGNLKNIAQRKAQETDK